MPVKVSGEEQIKRNIERIRKQLISASKKEVRKQSKRVLVAEKTEAPVDTGQLKASHSIDYSNGGLESAIGSDDNKAYYNIFVHYGHRTASGSFVPPNPWITRAFNKTKGSIKKGFETAYKAILR